MENVVREDGANRHLKDKRLVSVGVGATSAIVLLAIALVFTNAFGARQVADNARSLHWANAALGASAIARAANSQALVFAVDAELGTTSRAHAEEALAEAQLTLDELEAWRMRGSEVGHDDPGLAGALVTEVEAGRRVLLLLEAGDVETAATVNAEDYEAAHAASRELLETRQDVVAARIAGTEAAAGRIGSITRLLVTLAIPIGALLVYRSIARRQLDRDRERAAALLAAEQELHRAKDEFIASISHEIRTPLTSIYGFSEVLVETGVVDPDAAMELISLINIQSCELSRMVEDLLTAARIDAGALSFNPTRLAVADEIECVVAPLRRAGAVVAVDYAGGDAWADRVRFHQVLRNLVSNALKHGGPTVQVAAAVEGDRLLCIVADDGDGVPADLEGRLFQRFVHNGRESLLVGSVGLGLAIAHSLTASMGGELRYERQAGWTRFVVDLPRGKGRETAAVPAGTAADR